MLIERNSRDKDTLNAEHRAYLEEVFTRKIRFIVKAFIIRARKLVARDESNNAWCKKESKQY